MEKNPGLRMLLEAPPPRLKIAIVLALVSWLDQVVAQEPCSVQRSKGRLMLRAKCLDSHVARVYSK
jgi:hypothetical protein